jgi:hypothetical protein
MQRQDGRAQWRRYPGLGKEAVGTLSEDDLVSLADASTGDRLSDKQVPRGDPLRVSIEKLLSALEKNGTTSLFLSAVYDVRSEHRPDVVAKILQVGPEASKAVPDVGANLEVQKAGAVQPAARGGARI